MGATLIAVGIAAGYLDIATDFRFPFISDDFGTFLLVILVGLLLVFVCLIGLARRVKSGTRAKLACLVFAAPWMAGLVGYPIAGDNIHGPAGLLLLLILPTTILALVLLIMAGL